MKTIQVIPNPYSAIDADGVPQGVVGFPGLRGVWIGAALDTVASKKSGKTRFYFPAGNDRRKETTIAGMRVVTLNVSDANVRSTVAKAVLEGSLIVVTKADAAKLGIVSAYLEADKALDAEKARAQRKFRARHGDSVELGAIPHEPTPDEETDDEVTPTPAVPATGERVTSTVTRHPATEA